jgi:hypothetical protein
MLRAKQILRQAVDEGYLKKPADTAKGTKRGLKAANAKVSKRNRDKIDTPVKRMQLKIMTPPARPNRVRGGDMRGY